MATSSYGVDRRGCSFTASPRWPTANTRCWAASASISLSARRAEDGLFPSKFRVTMLPRWERDMTTTEARADIGAGANHTGIYLAVLQLVFTLGWTTYVIYLPKLAAQVGIAPATVILILMLDQAIFTVTDTAMGIAADKISALVGRLGGFVAILTAVSCAAFLA